MPPPRLDTCNVEEISLLKDVGVIQVLLPSYKKLLLKMGYKNVINIGNSIERQKNLSEKRNKEIICVGRLDKVYKRQHLLIQAFAEIAAKYPDWKLKFYGGNSTPSTYQNELEHMIHRYSLDHQIFLMGVQDKIIDKLKCGSIFVIPSFSEGFCIALAEALSAGLPCIGFKSCSAVNELIIDGFNGYLCEDGAENLAVALEKMICDDENRIKLGANAAKSISEYYPEKVYSAWSDVLSKFERNN